MKNDWREIAKGVLFVVGHLCIYFSQKNKLFFAFFKLFIFSKNPIIVINSFYKHLQVLIM